MQLGGVVVSLGCNWEAWLSAWAIQLGGVVVSLGFNWEA